MIKHAMKFDTKQPHQFIQEVKSVADTQLRNKDRAVFGKGAYEVRPEFQHLAVNDQQWSRLGPEGKMRKLEAFLKSGIGDKKTIQIEANSPRVDECNTAAAILIPVTASSCGITTVPIPILESMFERVNRLLQKSNLVLPKPGA